MDVRLRVPVPVVPPQNIADKKTEDNFPIDKVGDAGGTIQDNPGYNKKDDNRLTPHHQNDKDNLSQQNQSFVCIKEISVKVKSKKLWNVPFKFLQIAARELSVLLILIETLILLGGYLVILGVHHSIRYCLRKLRYKGYTDYGPSNAQLRNHYQPIVRPGGVPRPVPRGRMAGG